MQGKYNWVRRVAGVAGGGRLRRSSGGGAQSFSTGSHPVLHCAALHVIISAFITLKNKKKKQIADDAELKV